MTDSLEHLSAGCRNKAVADSGHVHQILALIIPNDERIEAVRPRDVARLLPTPDSDYPVLYPRARSFSRFIEAVFALSDNTFQLLLADGGKRVCRLNLELFSDPDSTWR